MKGQISSDFFRIPNNLEKSSIKNDEQLSGNRHQLTNFIKIYFDFAYFLGMSPFRFGRDVKGDIVLKQFWIQKMICGILHIFCILRLFTEVRLGFYDLKLQGSSNPVQYFQIVMNFISFTYKCTTMKAFWWKQGKYLEIFKLSKEKFSKLSQKHDRHYGKFLNPYFIRAFFGIFTIQCFLDLIVGKFFISSLRNWSPDFWVKQMVKVARFSFFLNDDLSLSVISNVTGAKEPEVISGVSGLNGILTFFMSLGLFQRYVQGFFSDLGIFSCALTLWFHAKVFATSLEGEEKWDGIYRDFRAVQRLSMVVNGAVGSQVTWYVAESVMYYSLNLNAVLTMENPARRMDMIYFYVLMVATLVISANVCSQLGSIKAWMLYGRNRYKVPAEEMNLVLHEMLSKDVGIRGSNVYTITYPFLAAMLSTIVTIFIISVQTDDRGGTDESYLAFSNSPSQKVSGS